MTRVDDLEEGMCIAITHCRDESEQSPDEMMFPFFRSHRAPQFDGRPLKILAISLPFLAVTDGSKTFSIDVRKWGVQKLSNSYVKAFSQRETVSRGNILTVGKTRKRKQKPDAMACPRCGNRMVKRLSVPGSGVWMLYCKQCGFEGDMSGATK